MEVNIDSLVLEVTRRCNERCEHCLRGKAQNLNMSFNIIDRVLDQINSISSVTFTGGEVTLYTKAIQYFVEGLKKRRMTIGGFYVVTNGKIASISLVHALIDLYSLVDSGDEEYTCGLAVSSDQFHEDVPVPSIYKALKFYRPDEKRGDINMEGVIDEGMAHYNGIGHRKEKVRPFEFGQWDNSSVSIEEDFYVSSNGNVISNCDLSYKRIDEEALGNILTQSLVDIIGANVKEEALCS